MTVADRPHGRGRYNAGCRCPTGRAANREHSRQRRSEGLTAVPPVAGSPPQPEFTDGPVTEAVRAQLAGTATALERPGLYAVAIRLAQLLDNPSAAPQFAGAGHRLTEILTTLSKSSTQRGRLHAVRNMTAQSDRQTLGRTPAFSSRIVLGTFTHRVPRVSDHRGRVVLLMGE